MTDKHPQTAYPQAPFNEVKEQELPGSEQSLKPKPESGAEAYVSHNRLINKIALITGADSGIGRAVAYAFAKEGCDVAIQYLPVEQQDADETASVIRGTGRRCVLLPADFTQNRQGALYEQIVADTVAAFGRIDVLVNNSAMQGKSLSRFEDLTYERVNNTFQINIISQFMITKFALPHMSAGSSVICTTSIQATQPSASIIDYATTKGAISTFVKGLSQELIDRGIRVNGVAPGPVWTPLVAASFDEEKLKSFGKTESPMKRPAQPAEEAAAFVFLACGEGQYINGAIIPVTGGKPL